VRKTQGGGGQRDREGEEERENTQDNLILVPLTNKNSPVPLHFQRSSL
jgi:hypothetical protein